MNIAGSVVFVTGASRGLGLAFAKVALAQGAAKVYAGVRNVEGFDVPGIIPVQIDVTSDDSVAAAAQRCQDTTLLINNAGIAAVQDSTLASNMIELTRHLMDTNTFSIVRTAQAFSPILSKNGGGAVINVLSDVTWKSLPMLAAYAASKSAAWSVTNALRLELKAQGTQVVAVHVGFIDTDLVKDFDVPKTAPHTVAEVALDSVNTGALEVMVDESTKQLKSSLSAVDAAYLSA